MTPLAGIGVVAPLFSLLREPSLEDFRALSLGEPLEDYTEMARVALGTVKWFNEASGYGYIVADEGGKDLFVHRGSIVGDWRTTTLAEGNRVEFERRQGGIGPEAIRVQLETGGTR